MLKKHTIIAFHRLLYSLLCLNLFLVVMGQLGKISFWTMGHNINVYFFEVGMGFVILLLLLRYRLAPYKSLFIRFGWVFAFLALMTVSLLISLFFYTWVENKEAILYILRLWLYFVYFLCSYYYIQQQPHLKKFLSVTVYLMALFTVFSSFAQYIYYPDLRNISYLGWDPHLNRMFGTFFDPPISGAVYGLLTVFIIFQATHEKNKKLLVLQIALTVGLISCIVLTYSRGAYLASIGTVLAFLLRSKNMRYVLVLFLVCAGIYFVLPKSSSEGVKLTRTTSIGTRFEDYQRGIAMWESHPFLGIGYNHIRAERSRTDAVHSYVYTDSHAGASFHSSFLMLLVTGGLLGFLSFCGVLYDFYRGNKMILYSVVFASILSLTDNVLLHPFVLIMLFAYVGIVGSL